MKLLHKSKIPLLFEATWLRGRLNAISFRQAAPTTCSKPQWRLGTGLRKMMTQICAYHKLSAFSKCITMYDITRPTNNNNCLTRPQAVSILPDFNFQMPLSLVANFNIVRTLHENPQRKAVRKLPENLLKINLPKNTWCFAMFIKNPGWPTFDSWSSKR